jgi:hypothetical protein
MTGGVVDPAPETENESVRHWDDCVTSLPEPVRTPFVALPTVTEEVEGPLQSCDH